MSAIFIVFAIGGLNLVLGVAAWSWFHRDLHPLVTEMSVDIKETQAESSEEAKSRRQSPKPEMVVEAKSALTDDEVAIPEQWLKVLNDAQFSNSFVEAAIEVLKLEVGRYREQLVDLDTELRRITDQPESPEFEQIVANIKQVNQVWLEMQHEATEHLTARSGKLGALADIASMLESTLVDQTAQIETTLNNLDHSLEDREPSARSRLVLNEVERLIDLAHILRDQMHESMVVILEREQRIAASGEAGQDPQTDLPNRTGIELIFRQWWDDDPDRIRLASTALIDIDNSSHLNQQFGARIADSMIIALSHVLQDSVRKERGFDRIARFSGQQFLIFLGDTGPRNAMAGIERLRQTVEAATFEVEDHRIQFTVSCAVAEVQSRDTSWTVCDRLRAAIQHAKKADGNRTVLDEGNGPQALPPPDYSVEERIVRVAT